MKKNKIDLFFKELARALDRPADVIVTGAVAAVLWGYERPSLDIDFEIRPRNAKNADADPLDTAIQSCAEKAGIAVNYSADISHWSMIDFLDYRKKAVPYRRFGPLRVKVMSPEHWTIGKMGRFFTIDIQDMVRIIKITKIKPEKLLKLWARAFRESGISLEKRGFRDHVLDFIKTQGKKIWEKEFDSVRAARLFKKEAGLPL